MASPNAAWPPPRPPDCNAALVLADGTVFWGRGIGAAGKAVGEVCFNTSITGYQEILTDPSYAGQIITFTFPHIGNVGANYEDIEATTPAARGLVIRGPITEAANYRATQSLDAWLKSHGIVGLSGVDTRRLTRLIRDKGAPNGVIAYDPEGRLDIGVMREEAQAWPGLEGMDLAKEVTCLQSYDWTETVWRRIGGYGRQEAPRFHVVAVDYGAKRNILRMLAEHGCRVTVVPATASAEDIMRHEPDGIFLSNGPGDPAATGEYALPILREVIASGKPVFGICLGHQMLALALGGRTYKLDKGHRGANHPVRDDLTGKVEITSQNHGFVVDPESLPNGVAATHTSLFDRTNEGLRLEDRPVFSVQHHPEASPGPQDSHYLFQRFIALMESSKKRIEHTLKYPVRRFKSLAIALKELEPFIRNGEHLQTGKPFEKFGGMRSREILANWLLCVAINAIDNRELTFSSDPIGGDGIISDTATEETWQTEHVTVPRLRPGDGGDSEALILKAIEQKRRKGGAAYARGKTLVVFMEAGSGTWYPNRVARQLPDPILFSNIWVVGLHSAEDGKYVYNVTLLDTSEGNAPAALVRLGTNFDSWVVERIQ